MNKRLKKYLILVVILLVLVTVILVMAANKPKIEAVSVTEKVWTVNAVMVERGDISPVYPLLGTVESNGLVNAASPVNGVVANTWVREGEDFKKGQKLLSLAKDDLQLPVMIAQANVASAQATLELQKLTYSANKQNLKHEKALLAIKEDDVARNQRLNKKNLNSATRLDSAKEALVRQKKSVVAAKLIVAQFDATLIQLEASLKSAQVSLKQAQLNLQRGELIAPFDGKVAKLLVAPGDRVNVGSVMIRFYEKSSLELRVKIPSTHLKNIHQSVLSGAKLTASYLFNGQEYSLPFVRFAGESSASGLDAFLQVPTDLFLVSLGSLMQVNLKGEAFTDVFAVPFSALYGSNKIFIIDKDSSELVSLNVQKMGVDQQNRVLLKADLEDGDLVLTTHLPNAINGLNVTVNQGEH